MQGISIIHHVIRPWAGLLAMMLTHVVCVAACAQQTHVVLNDARALVTRIEISPAETYTLRKHQMGDIWIAIDPVELVTMKDGRHLSKQLPVGEAAIVGSEEELIFRVKSSAHARLVVVKPKMPHDELTVQSFVLGSLEDASDRKRLALCSDVALPFS